VLPSRAFVHLSLLVGASLSALIRNASGGISLGRLCARVNRFGDEMTPWGEKTNHMRAARSWTMSRPRLSAACFPFSPFGVGKRPLWV
jgi:hypothetical protein